MAIKCQECNSEHPDGTSYCSNCGTNLSILESAQISRTVTAQAQREEITIGSTFAGRYQIIEELGKGGMGKVYRVLDKKLDEQVALKLIKPEVASDKKTLERFRNELKLARKISHRNVGRMYELMEDKGTHFITMEYVPGEDLRSFIRRSGQLAMGTVVRIGRQICEGLVEAHRVGVVHRDLKPNNVMIDKQGNVKILDFGIARSLDVKGLTDSGIVLGTPEYMSPEQAEGKEVDGRSDVYSLGVILYEMAAGRLPFEGKTPLSIAMKHKGERPKDPRELNPQAPMDLSQLILKCMEKEEERRYQSAEELLSDLEKVEKCIPTTERKVPKRKPITSKEITVSFSLKKLFVPALVLTALIIAAVIILRLLPQKELITAPRIENSIAVISFKNQTGDKAYDYLQEAIPNLLITSLEQAGAQYVVTWERMDDLLKQLGKEDVEAIDRNLGFKICRMEGIGAIVLGSFIKAGEMFATDVKVLDVETKKLLKSASSKGEGEGSIIKTQIDELSREISRGIGLSEPSKEGSLPRITDVTTDSMEAYNYYLKGREAQSKLYWEDARKFYKKAVELDPSFATAYGYLANAYSWLGDTKARNEAYEKARALLEKTSGREKLYLEASIALYFEGNPVKYVNILNGIVEKYPREKRAYFSLGYYYQNRGKGDQAIEEYKKVLELDPNNGLTLNQLGYTFAEKENYEKAIEYFKRYASAYPADANPYDSIGEIYYLMGRLDDAAAKFKDAVDVKSDFYNSYNKIGYIYALKESYPLAIDWIEQGYKVAQSPGRKADSLLWRAFIHYWLGRYEDALLELQEAANIAGTLKNRGMIIFIENSKGWICYEKGQLELSQKYYKNWFDLCLESNPKDKISYQASYSIVLGLIDLKKGQIHSAKSKLTEAKSLQPNLEFDPNDRNRFMYCLLYGEIALAENQPERAVEVFKKLKPIRATYPTTGTIISQNIPFLMRDILARGYQQEGKIDEAITEYKRLITFDSGGISRLLIHPKYHYRIAQLFKQKDWKDRALEHYEKFLNFWKNADPDILEIEDAKKMAAELKSQ